MPHCLWQAWLMWALGQIVGFENIAVSLLSNLPDVVMASLYVFRGIHWTILGAIILVCRLCCMDF